MERKNGQVPRAEGWFGGRRVDPEEKVVLGGAAVIEMKKSAVTVINESVEENQVPSISEMDFLALYSIDAKTAQRAEDKLKKKLRDSGIDPEKNGMAIILVDGKRKRMALGDDFGTVEVE